MIYKKKIFFVGLLELFVAFYCSYSLRHSMPKKGDQEKFTPENSASPGVSPDKSTGETESESTPDQNFPSSLRTTTENSPASSDAESSLFLGAVWTVFRAPAEPASLSPSNGLRAAARVAVWRNADVIDHRDVIDTDLDVEGRGGCGGTQLMCGGIHERGPAVGCGWNVASQ